MATLLGPSFVVLALLCVTSGARAAERMAILPFSGTNVHPGYLQAAQELLRDHLAVSGRYQLMSVGGEPPTVELTTDEVVQAGQTAGSELVVAGHIVRLQSLVRMRVTVYRVATGQQVFSDSMAGSGGPDQLDPVLRRLAASIVSGKPAKDNAEIDSVTESESEAYMKKAATRVFGLKLGMLAPLSRPGNDASVGPMLGIFWLYDARTFLGEIFLDLATKDNLHAFNVGLAAYHPFERGDSTPYVGGGVAWSAVDFGGQGQSGLRAHGAVGMLLGRLSTVQIRGELGYFVNLFSEKSDLFSSPQETSDSTISHGPMLSVGLGL